MHRLFVGIDPPFSVKDTLVARMGGIIGARWQREDQLHLTLRFIGEVDTRQANDIAECLSGVRHPAFDVGLGAPGTFDRKGRIDTLWIAVSPAEPVKALHNKVDRALSRIGIAPETRAFLPHITLARFSRGAGSLDGYLSVAESVRPPSFRVDAFCLYESRLTHDGASYMVIERYPLAASSA
jgi:2'-5' RNA ligase